MSITVFSDFYPSLKLLLLLLLLLLFFFLLNVKLKYMFWKLILLQLNLFKTLTGVLFTLLFVSF